jgi:hypothetical protein
MSAAANGSDLIPLPRRCAALAQMLVAHRGELAPYAALIEAFFPGRGYDAALQQIRFLVRLIREEYIEPPVVRA